MTHTPGPWRIEERNGMAANQYGRFNVSASHYSRPGVIDGRDCVVEVRDEANARLIAAAPDLLEALKNLVAFLDDQDNFKFTEEARAAIAKAEGK
jgi:hypothetical protein